MTRAEVRRQKKRKDRERRIRRSANIRRNESSPDYRLDVCIDDKWYLGVMDFKTKEDAHSYNRELESKRQKGEGIIGGRVVSLKTGEIILFIDPSPKKDIKGALPDKLSDNPDAAQKAILDKKKSEEPYSV